MVYMKQGFADGNVLKASQLNHMESGIESAENTAQSAINTANSKQDKLVSGVNIKTINGQSLLGSGDVTINGGGGSADLTGYLTKDEASTTYASKTDLQGKQDTLVSGTNIKTVNGQSLLGSGDITIEGGSGGSSVTVDSELSSTSPNPVQNKVIKTELDKKQDKLVSGTSLKTVNGQSLLGSGNIENKKSISILFIGNSMTQDVVAYLPYMLKTYYPEVDFKIYLWYIASLTLEQQFAAFTGSTKADIFSVAENSGTWTNYNRSKTMANVLANYSFDIVCMQEYFNHKTEYADVRDWDNCRNYIISNYKGGNGLEFVSLFHAPKRNAIEDAYNMTLNGNALILQSTIAQDMIAGGIAVYNAFDTDLDTLGDQQHLSNDGTHTQEGLPCLLQTYVALLWTLERLGINKSIYGSPMRMTTAIYNSISVPGANLGRGVVTGTEAQNLLAQEVAIKAYKEGKQFVMKNLSTNISFGGGSAPDIKYTFTIVPVPADATVLINDVEQTSVEVQEGRKVSWSVSKDGYITQRGIEAVNYDMTKTVTLREAGDIDEATQAYLNATGISDADMVSKLDTMVTSLKSEGLWDKIDALYPCVGSTFEQMSYNLKDPSAYKLSANVTPTVTKDVGFYSTQPVTSNYNSSRLGTDLHLLGVSGTARDNATLKYMSVGPSSLSGKYAESGSATVNDGVYLGYTTGSVYVRTAVSNNWTAKTTAPDFGLYMASLSSGIVLNGSDTGATKTGTPNIESYPSNFVHNGYENKFGKPDFAVPIQVRLSGFGGALTVEEMQTYSAILNEFKGIY